MNRFMLKSKIKGARVTETKLYYEGSITLDEDILSAADIACYAAKEKGR